MRKVEKFLIVDIETCNKVEDALAYDIGLVVTDRRGNIYHEASYLLYDTFVLEKSLMKSAYYAVKIPQYEKELSEGKHEIRRILTVKREIERLMKEYSIKKVFAYNANFDYSGLNRTLRYITKSRVRWFFPYGTEIQCIWSFACSVLSKRPTYGKFCEEHGYISNRGKNYKSSAEVVYQYITKNPLFREGHKGLEDVRIETEILAWCYSRKTKVETNINRACWRKLVRETS